MTIQSTSLYDALAIGSAGAAPTATSRIALVNYWLQVRFIGLPLRLPLVFVLGCLLHVQATKKKGVSGWTKPTTKHTKKQRKTGTERKSPWEMKRGMAPARSSAPTAARELSCAAPRSPLQAFAHPARRQHTALGTAALCVRRRVRSFVQRERER